MNTVILTGRLTRDPELRYTVEELPIASFVVAVDRYGKKGKEADFIRVKCFGKLADFVEKWTGKGLWVEVHGRIHVDKYEKEGQKKEYYEVIADEVQPVEWKKQDENFTFDTFNF